MRGVDPLEEIIRAFEAIDAAESHYRNVLRRHLASGTVRQVDVAKRLDRTREMVRRDAMDEEQRAEMRRLDAQRKRSRMGRSAGKPDPT